MSLLKNLVSSLTQDEPGLVVSDVAFLSAHCQLISCGFLPKLPKTPRQLHAATSEALAQRTEVQLVPNEGSGVAMVILPSNWTQAKVDGCHKMAYQRPHMAGNHDRGTDVTLTAKLQGEKIELEIIGEVPQAGESSLVALNTSPAPLLSLELTTSDITSSLPTMDSRVSSLSDLCLSEKVEATIYDKIVSRIAHPMAVHEQFPPVQPDNTRILQSVETPAFDDKGPVPPWGSNANRGGGLFVGPHDPVWLGPGERSRPPSLFGPPQIPDGIRQPHPLQPGGGGIRGDPFDPFGGFGEPDPDHLVVRGIPPNGAPLGRGGHGSRLDRFPGGGPGGFMGGGPGGFMGGGPGAFF